MRGRLPALPAVEPPEMTAPDAKKEPPVSTKYTVSFSFARTTSESCKVPRGSDGGAKVAQFNIFDSQGVRVKTPLTVTERFRKIKGPDEVFEALKPNTYVARRGRFGDCYLIAGKNLPRDLRLVVEQNNIIDGEIVSKNRITYTSTGVLGVRLPALRRWEELRFEVQAVLTTAMRIEAVGPATCAALPEPLRRLFLQR